MKQIPCVTVIIPMFNEERYIAQCLESVLANDYPKDLLEILVVDGGSTDRSRDIVVEYLQRYSFIHLLDNPKRIMSSALNIGIRNARGEIIVRMDAHALPDPRYISRCIEILRAGIADIVGGRWIIEPGAPTVVAEAIALAVSHPFGAGDAVYRYGGAAGYVDTVPFGAFHKGLVFRVGLYDESLFVNEDYEFNYRVRRAGGRVFFSPDIISRYYARSTLRALARQYYRYGWWKVRMLRKYPAAVRWRQLVAPMFLLSLAAASGGAVIWPIFRIVLGMIFFAYTLASLTTSVIINLRRGSWRTIVWLPVAFAIIHFSWAAGFLSSLIALPFSRLKSQIPKSDRHGIPAC